MRNRVAVRRNVFATLPVELWSQILSHFCFTDAAARRLHIAMSRACRASHLVTSHELVWQARLVIVAVRLGFATLRKPLAPTTAADRISDTGAARVPSSRPHAATASDAGVARARWGATVSSADDVNAAAWHLDLRKYRDATNAAVPALASVVSRHHRGIIDGGIPSDPHDAPIAHALFADSTALPLWRQRVQYLYFLVSMRCCVCVTVTVHKLSQRDARAGLEFIFPHVRLPGAASGAAPTVRPWAGLRICASCLMALRLQLLRTPDHVLAQFRAPRGRQQGAAHPVRRERGGGGDGGAVEGAGAGAGAGAAGGGGGEGRATGCWWADVLPRVLPALGPLDLGAVTTLPDDVGAVRASRWLAPPKIHGLLRFSKPCLQLANVEALAALPLADPFRVRALLLRAAAAATGDHGVPDAVIDSDT